MASILSDSRRELLLGIGAATGSLVLGLVLAGIAVIDRIALLSEIAVVAVLLCCGFVYGIGGLYDIVALGIPQRGVAHLVTGAGIVLALLAPYGAPDRLFVATAAVALLIGAGYHAAIVVDFLSTTEEPAAEIDSDGEAS